MKNMQIISESTVKNINIPVLLPILIYACCFTENLTGYGLFFSTSISDTFFSLNSKLITISIFCCLLSAGMFSFAFTSHIAKGKLLNLVTLICLIRILIWICIYTKISSIASFNTLLIILYALDLGYISAFAFYRGLKLTKRDYFARYIGFSLATAVLLTMFIGKLHLEPINSNFYLGLICQVLIFLSFHIKFDSHPLELTARKARISQGMKRYLKNSIILVSAMSFLHGMTDGVDYFIFKNSEVDVVHEYYRLFYVLSLITAAILYDKFKYYQMLLAILATGLLILAFQLYNTEYFNVVHYLDSICSGFIIVFIMNIFADASVVTDKPWLWCNLGRVIQFALNSLGSMLAVWLLDIKLTATSLFIFLILQCILIFMLYHGSMNYQIEKQYRSLSIRLNKELEKNQTSAVSIDQEGYTKERKNGQNIDTAKSSVLKNRLLGNAVKSDKRRIKDMPSLSKKDSQIPELGKFIADHSLTTKEAEILKEILQLKSIKDMAFDLNITERTVKYRISRIFEKTGTKNQRELLKKINE